MFDIEPFSFLLSVENDTAAAGGSGDIIWNGVEEIPTIRGVVRFEVHAGGCAAIEVECAIANC